MKFDCLASVQKHFIGKTLALGLAWRLKISGPDNLRPVNLRPQGFRL